MQEYVETEGVQRSVESRQQIESGFKAVGRQEADCGGPSRGSMGSD